MGAAVSAQRLRVTLGRQVPYLGPVLAWLMVIAALSTDAASSARTSDPVILAAHRLLFGQQALSPAEMELLSKLVRKPMHFLEYAVLGLLLYRWLRFSWLAPRLVLICTAIGIALGCAGIDEFHQTFVASRTGTLGDVGYDGGGAVFGVLVILLWSRRRRARRAGGGRGPDREAAGSQR